MTPPLAGNGFMSVPASETQSTDRSSSDIQSRPRKSQFQEVTTSTNEQQGLYQPVSRSRPAPAHHFWKKPLSLGTVIFIGDLLLTLAPCLFIILASEALIVSGKPITSRGETVEQAASLSPTIFPIVFAAIVGRLMRTFALWRAERGASLGILEQLTGSQNLLAAFERAVLLPGLGFLSIAVVLLWALSPLGGQSSLRVLHRAQESTHDVAALYYFDNSGDSVNTAFVGASSLSSGGTTLSGILQAALLSLERVKGNDLWGNVKTPFLEHVPSYVAGDEKDGWYDFSEDDYNASYSALTGVVVSGLKDGLDTNFTMASSYFNLTCMEPRFFATDANADGADFYGGLIEWAGNLTVHTNTSRLFSQSGSGGSALNSYFLDTNVEGAKSGRQFNIIYVSQGASVKEIAAYNCTMEAVHVDNDIFCQGSACRVQRMRPSRDVIEPTGQWPFASEAISVPWNMLTFINGATSSTHSGMVSPIDWYVSGSNTPFQLDYSTVADVDYTKVDTAQVAQRLGSLINTAFQASYQQGATAQPPSDNFTALELGMNSSTTIAGVGYRTRPTTGSTTMKEERFVARQAWVAITLVVACILLFCGITGMIYKYGSRSPDILGFVSSMTRDNPNFEHIPGGDRLDGLQRARVLRHMKVQIADAMPWHDEGHVTLRNLGRVEK